MAEQTPFSLKARFSMARNRLLCIEEDSVRWQQRGVSLPILSIAFLVGPLWLAFYSGDFVAVHLNPLNQVL